MEGLPKMSMNILQKKNMKCRIYEKIESASVRLNIDAAKNEEKLINLCNHLICGSFTYGEDPMSDEIVELMMKEGDIDLIYKIKNS